MTAIKKYLNQPIDIASLAAFRVLFGALMLFSVIRFMLYGWVHDLYIKPSYFFTYWGFDWVKPWPAWGLYLHFALLAVLALMIMVGLYYRWATLLFFLGFTYVELLDKTNYLNHYYFVSLVAFLMIFMPLNRAYSLDARRKPEIKSYWVPYWPLLALRLQLGLVYFFAGLAKLNSDWLFHAQPLRIWLSVRQDLPLIGPLLALPATAFVMSWAGALYDLSIPFFLSWKRSRFIAYLAVIFFHVMTWVLFNIGVFPWVMIVATLVFFEPDWPRKLFRGAKPTLEVKSNRSLSGLNPLGYGLLTVFFLLQVALPLRHFLYPSNVYWSEEGFRFSWKVMLMEKTGSVEYIVQDPGTGKKWTVNPKEYLAPHQISEFSHQPDMILALAKTIAKDFEKKGFPGVEVRARVQASLNGRMNQTLIDPAVNLAAVQDGLAPYSWVLPFRKTPPP